MPPELTVFLDENHHNNQRVLAVLAELGVPVERHGTYFAPGVADVVWLPLLRERRWALLTTDKRIRYRALENAAVRENSLAMFCFTANFGAAQMEFALRAAIPRMRRIVATQPTPFIAVITQSGEVNVRETFGVTLNG